MLSFSPGASVATSFGAPSSWETYRFGCPATAPAARTPSATEYTYTTQLVGARRVDDNHYVAIHHLEGNFPGGVADLQFKFPLHEGRISQLTIEP